MVLADTLVKSNRWKHCAFNILNQTIKLIERNAGGEIIQRIVSGMGRYLP